MNTIKKLRFFIVVTLAGITLVTSCSKEPEVKKVERRQTKETNKGKKASVETKGKSISPDARNTLNAIRNRQNVKLNWHIGAPSGKIEQINISRNTTGTEKQRKRVVELKPDATSYEDILPNENAHWYWLRLIMEDGKFQEVGPIRVEADKAGPAGYMKQEDQYKISITRTEDFATIKWDFPEDEYKLIKITCSLRPAGGVSSGTKKGNNVLTTMERKSECVKALPDPNANYWYWFQITLKSGTIINRGPIKAEYVNQ